MCGKTSIMFLGVAGLALMQSYTQAAPLQLNLDSEALMSALRQVAPQMAPARQYGDDNEDDSAEERQQHDPNHEYRRQMAGWHKLASALQSYPEAARQEDDDELDEAEQRAHQVRGAAAADGKVYEYQRALGMAPAQAPERAAHQNFDDNDNNDDDDEGGSNRGRD